MLSRERRGMYQEPAPALASLTEGRLTLGRAAGTPCRALLWLLLRCGLDWRGPPFDASSWLAPCSPSLLPMISC